jgi:antitoxin FitA
MLPLWFHYGTKDSTMATLTIKNVPESLCRRLKQRAAEHRRSINGEVIASLERALMAGRVDPREFLARARLLRERMPNAFITEKDLRTAKSEGRA